MRYPTLITTVIFSFCIVLINSCKEANDRNVPIAAAVPVNLNAIETTLPDAPGYTTFKMNCLSCHSARYIKMQPHLPEKTWTAIVTKMQKGFGAPFSDSSAREIVRYLVAIKGKSKS